MSSPSEPPLLSKAGMHPRNRHRQGYNFKSLVSANPSLAGFLTTNPAGRTTIDFSNAQAVFELNRALLFDDYGLQFWELPENCLCPPIPGRADYLHAMADLLSEASGTGIPKGEMVRVLDVGVGANCIYPILGRCDYGWSFVGTDIDEDALASAGRIVAGNPCLAGAVDLRLQRDPGAVFRGIVREGEHFAFSLCNPPFHGSARDAEEGTLRKMRSLAGRTLKRDARADLNFGGKAHELVCKGGELGFILRLVSESAEWGGLCDWFSCLVSKSENLRPAEAALKRAKAKEIRVMPMSQGQKKSRILAWRFC